MFIKMVDELMVETLSGWEHGSTVVILDEALKVFDTQKKKKMHLEVDQVEKILFRKKKRDKLIDPCLTLPHTNDSLSHYMGPHVNF